MSKATGMQMCRYCKWLQYFKLFCSTQPPCLACAGYRNDTQALLQFQMITASVICLDVAHPCVKPARRSSIKGTWQHERENLLWQRAWQEGKEITCYGRILVLCHDSAPNYQQAICRDMPAWRALPSNIVYWRRCSLSCVQKALQGVLSKSWAFMMSESSTSLNLHSCNDLKEVKHITLVWLNGTRKTFVNSWLGKRHNHLLTYVATLRCVTCVMYCAGSGQAPTAARQGRLKFLSPINCADLQQKLTYCQYFCLTQTRYATSRFSAALSSEHWCMHHSCVHVERAANQ